MIDSLTLVPAYGRDYKSQKAVKKDWEEGKDFVIATVLHNDCGRYCNKTDLKDFPGTIFIRYLKKTRIIGVK